MNFIEAWKKANGKKIEIGNVVISTKDSITAVVEILNEIELLSENWEITKKEIVIWTMTYYDKKEKKYRGIVFSSRKQMEEWTEENDDKRIIAINKHIDEV